jgi:hypothetical protein
MEQRYDLFEFPPDAFPKWIGSASDLPEARKKMENLPPPAPGSEYLVRDFYFGTVVTYTRSERSLAQRSFRRPTTRVTPPKF